MDLHAIRNRQELIVNTSTTINTYVFDDLSAINQDRNKAYPLLLAKPPQSLINGFAHMTNSANYEDFTWELYFFDTWQDDDKPTKDLDEKYTDLHKIGIEFVQTFLEQGSNDYYLAEGKVVNIERGHFQHVDNLVGVKYTFVLKSFLNASCSGLGIPTELTATAISTTQINLAWNDNSSSETGYEVWRSVNLHNWTKIATIAADSTSYPNTGLDAGSVYCYQVRPIDANGGGQFSNIACEKTIVSDVKTLKGIFTAGDDEMEQLTIDADSAGAYSSIADDGSSGTITVSKNGSAFGAFVSPTTLAIGDTWDVKRTISTALGFYKLTGV